MRKIQIKKKLMCKEDRNFCGLGRCQELMVLCFVFCHCDKHNIQNQLGEGGLISAYSLLSIIKGSQDCNSRQRLDRNKLIGLLLMVFSATFLIQARITLPEMAPLNSELGLFTSNEQLRKCPTDISKDNPIEAKTEVPSSQLCQAKL